MRPTLEATTVALHALLGHVPGYEIEDNKVGRSDGRSVDGTVKKRRTVGRTVVRTDGRSGRAKGVLIDAAR